MTIFGAFTRASARRTGRCRFFVMTPPPGVATSCRIPPRASSLATVLANRASAGTCARCRRFPRSSRASGRRTTSSHPSTAARRSARGPPVIPSGAHRAGGGTATRTRPVPTAQAAYACRGSCSSRRPTNTRGASASSPALTRATRPSRAATRRLTSRGTSSSSRTAIGSFARLQASTSFVPILVILSCGTRGRSTATARVRCQPTHPRTRACARAPHAPTHAPHTPSRRVLTCTCASPSYLCSAQAARVRAGRCARAARAS